MNRRDFLRGIVGAASALVLPEPARVRVYSFMPESLPFPLKAPPAPAWFVSSLTEGLLERTFHDGLFPNMLFRTPPEQLWTGRKS